MKLLDKQARDKKIVNNLSLVWFVIHKYFNNINDHEDLYSAGVIGLIHAVDRFDPAKGFEWTTYAVKSIWGEIRKNLRDNRSLIHTTRSQQVHVLL